MPTKRPRYTVTETGPVADVLAELRREAGDGAVDPAEIFLLGAREKLRLATERRDDEERRRRLRLRFSERTRTGRGVDGEAALAVREHGWQHGE